MSQDEEGGVPTAVVENVGDFHQKISNLEDVLRPVLATTLDKCHENMTPLEKAKFDLVALYTANSMFWTYLSTKGLNPKDYFVVNELERVKSYMDKIKQIEDKSKAPKIDKTAAKNFVRNAMFDPDKDDKHGKNSALVDTDNDGECTTSSLSKKDKTVELKSLARELNDNSKNVNQASSKSRKSKKQKK